MVLDRKGARVGVAVGTLRVLIVSKPAHDNGAGDSGVVLWVPDPYVATRRRVGVAYATALLLALCLGQGETHAVDVDVTGDEGYVLDIN